MSRTFRKVESFVYSLLAAALTASWSIPMADAQRGVSGRVGGEYILIIGAFLIVLCITYPNRKGGNRK